MNTTVEKLLEIGHSPVNGDHPRKLSDILLELKAMFLKYLELETSELGMLLALWCTQTYALQQFAYCGYLSFESATPRCGKSRCLELISLVVSGSPTISTQPSAAGLYRSLRQVILLDEIDRLRNQDKDTFGDVMAILNVGFKRGSVVERCERTKEGFVVKEYPAFRAIAFAGLERLNDALRDRCFPIQLKRATHRMPRLNPRKLEAESWRLRSEIECWVAGNSEDIQKTYDALPDETKQLMGFDDRCQDISEPLLVLASLADVETGEGTPITDNFLCAMRTITERREPSTREQSYIAFINLVEAQLNGETDGFIRSQTIVDLCQEDEQLSFIETPRRLANFVKPLDLSPINKGGGLRGYPVSQEWVKEWKDRYQP